MPHLRIIHDNAADRATLTVSSSASAALGAANLKTDRKGEVWRTVGASGSITAEWPTAQTLGGVALAYTNLRTSATIRVQAYTLPGDAVPAYDSGVLPACPGVLAQQLEGQVPGVNTFGYAGAPCARLWFPTLAARKIVVTLSDANHPSGYLEFGRLICGRYWEAEKNVDYSASVTPVDRSELSRSDAGDLVADIGTQHRKMVLPLPNAGTVDRNSLWNILWNNGKRRPVFASLFPEDTDVDAEQQHQIYARLVTSPAMTLASFKNYATTLELEEI